MQKIKNSSKGFTLLELLVVVLIIGLLAAIALPQYQLSVDRSKFAGYRIMTKNLADAYWRYILTNNDAPTDLDQLDIELPSGYEKTTPKSSSCAVFDDSYCCIGYPKYNFQNGHVVCGKKDNTFASVLSLVKHGNMNQNASNKTSCMAKNNDARATRLCKSFSYSSSDSADLPAQHGHKIGYTYYVLTD